MSMLIKVLKTERQSEEKVYDIKASGDARDAAEHELEEMLGYEPLGLGGAPRAENAAAGGEKSPSPFGLDGGSDQRRHDHTVGEQTDGGKHDHIRNRRHQS